MRHGAVDVMRAVRYCAQLDAPDTQHLPALDRLQRENRQGEYYLNEVFPILMDKGERISAVNVDAGGAMGINSRGDLAGTARVVRERINAEHMSKGVTLVDPASTFIDVDVRIGPVVATEAVLAREPGVIGTPALTGSAGAAVR